MKSVLISIQPKWCELIALGQKTVEVRKTKPKLETPFKVYIYCTKQGKQFFHGGIGEKEVLFKNPDTGKIKFDYSFELMHCKNEYTKDNFLSGKVIGEFVCDQIDEIGYSPEMHGKYISDIDDIHYVSCLNFEQMFDYLADGYGYAWHISDLVIYDKPRELSEFKRTCDGNCQECKYAIWENARWYNEPKIVDCQNITAPQSWRYIEERSDKECSSKQKTMTATKTL